MEVFSYHEYQMSSPFCVGEIYSQSLVPPSNHILNHLEALKMKFLFLFNSFLSSGDNSIYTEPTLNSWEVID